MDVWVGLVLQHAAVAAAVAVVAVVAVVGVVVGGEVVAAAVGGGCKQVRGAQRSEIAVEVLCW